jgi:hypothetical protein
MERRVFIVLSARSISYAKVCIETLLCNSLEPIALTLVTDDDDDKAVFEKLVSGVEAARDRWRVLTKADCDEIARERFARFPNLQALRDGHPCWLKITDPLLLSEPEDEAIILDPDLYFPNRFRFEPTPRTGVFVMRQGPNCLFPPEAVRRVMELGVPLAKHIDIGVGQLRGAAVDFEWLDWLLSGFRPAAQFSRFLHIEAIVWAALAMRHGGGHLNPTAWRCWERGHVKRMLVAAGVKGELLLKLEPLHRVKCIHVSGPSKWWVVDAVERGILRPMGRVLDKDTEMVPYRELTQARYRREQRVKKLGAKMGYGRLG